ncbi:MAG: cobalamin-dependent protein [Anaerolineae bacterium]|nr:cobalamin-dependent protein [Anaerolineae bacterium]
MGKETINQAILERSDELAEALVALQYERQPDLAERYGPQGRGRCVEDACHHFAYLAEAVAVSSQDMFADYAQWLGLVLEKRGVEPGCLSESFDCLLDVLRRELPPDAHALLSPYVRAAQERLARPVDSDSLLTAEAPHAALARAYLNHLLAGDRHASSQLILDAVEDGVSVRDVYLHVFQPVQHEIGRLWQVNEISVAQEHYATAVTQLVMSRLYPHIFATKRSGQALVATCVSGELHEIGARMVADFFEMAGWDTFYLGANTPTASIVQTLLERGVGVLAVSATMSVHVSGVERLIAALRASEARDVKVLVGGYPFNLVPGLWQRIGADGYAANADAAIDVAGRLALS